MVTAELIAIATDLLDGWQTVLLQEEQRALFLKWLRAHTKADVQPETFKERLVEWLSGMSDLKQFHTDVLIIHAEIVWAARQKVEDENTH